MCPDHRRPILGGLVRPLGRARLAGGGTIGLVRDGDVIELDIPNRRVQLLVPDEELAARRAEQDAKGWQPVSRERPVSDALKIFAKFAQSADKGAARKVD